MSLTTDVIALGVLGAGAYYLYSKLDISVESAAAAVDQRQTDSMLGAVQSAVSSAVEKVEAQIRAAQTPRPVQVRQYSFDSNKWGD